MGETADGSVPKRGHRRLTLWIVAGVLIFAVTVLVGIEFGSTQAWGLGAILFGLYAAAPVIIAHVSGVSPEQEAVPETRTEKAQPVALGAESVQSARDIRRPYYSNAIEALRKVSEHFDAVREWVAAYAEHGSLDRHEWVLGRGHQFHTPSLAPLVAQLDASIGQAYRAVEEMELEGSIPAPVIQAVSWYPRRAEILLDVVKGAYVVKPERNASWRSQAEELQFVIYRKAINAMKADLRHPDGL